MSWEKLSDMKESHPLQMAEYAIAMDVDQKLSFNWWVPHTFRKHDVHSAKYLKCMHKFGIECLKTFDPLEAGVQPLNVYQFV